MLVTVLLKEEPAEHYPDFIGFEMIYREIAALTGTELLGDQVHSAAITAAA